MDDVTMEAVDTAVDESSAEESTPQQAAEERRRLKAKIDGEEIEVDEEELLRDYQKYKSADKRYQEAAQIRKQAEGVIEYFRQNPAEAMRHLGLDPHKVAEETMLAHIEEMMMDPKDRELKTYKQQVEEYRKAEREAKEKADREKAEQLKMQMSAELSNEIIEALNTESLPRTPWTIKRMASYLYEAESRKIPVTAKDVVKQVKKDYLEDQKVLFGEMDVEKIVETFGEDILKKIRKWDIDRIKKRDGAKYVPERKGPPQERTQKKKLSEKEWRALNERFKHGLE